MPGEPPVATRARCCYIRFSFWYRSVSFLFRPPGFFYLRAAGGNAMTLKKVCPVVPLQQLQKHKFLHFFSTKISTIAKNPEKPWKKLAYFLKKLKKILAKPFDIYYNNSARVKMPVVINTTHPVIVPPSAPKGRAVRNDRGGGKNKRRNQKCLSYL